MRIVNSQWVSRDIKLLGTQTDAMYIPYTSNEIHIMIQHYVY